MKKIISLITVVAIVAVSAFCLSACNDNSRKPVKSDEPFAESVVLGIHDNFPGLGTNAQTIYERTFNACLNYGEVSYVVVEGEPSQTKTFPISKSDKDISKSKEKELAQRNANSILQSFASLKALTPEVDTLSSIKLSANILKASTLSQKNMLVYDSGLCTTGLLSQLSSNVLATDPVIVVDKLEAIHALPDLEGVSVCWVGLGCVSGNGNQQKIPDSYLYNLKALWSEIIERSGGTVVFDSTPVTGQQAEDLPHVTAVDFPQDSLELNSGNITDISVISFKEDTVKFVGNRAAFADAVSAEKALEPIAEYLKTNPEKRILIAGTTAKVGTGDGKELSYQRTQIVKNVLLESGVSSSQIECIGLGCTDNCFRVEDHNSDGSLNKEMAAQNRAIYIVLADSATAQTLKDT